MTAIEKAIIRTLLYFDIFGHPLTKSELYVLLGIKADKAAYEKSLAELENLNFIRSASGYLFLQNGTSSAEERENKRKRSLKYQKISRIVASLIYNHPFVKGILISGSLSKGSFSKKDDIDFFIIADPGRIWLCRAFLMMFKKIFLLNSKKYFCINYFIDSDSLEIPDKNIFTATEIAFLVPVRNTKLCREFFCANKWIYDYFPNLKIELTGCREASALIHKQLIERLLRRKSADRIDNWLMGLYRKRSMKKFYHSDGDQFQVNIKNEKNVSKYHPNGFQHRILHDYNLKISEFQTVHNMDLTLMADVWQI
jgi:hypothetical protein